MGIQSMLKYINYSVKDINYYVQKESVSENLFNVENIDEDWSISQSDNWTFYNNENYKLSEQGWKVHISSEFSSLDETLKIVSKLLIERKIPFKHLRSREVAFSAYSKNANRISSGKFITIYPNESMFLELLDLLYDDLKHMNNGPYILTDRQWKDSNIYYRYGAFINMYNQDNVLCIKDLNGNLIPDLRKAEYYLPDFVTEPSILTEMEEVYNPPSNASNKLSNYNIKETIRYSNSGGIYIAEDKNTHKKYIIKEAREAVGLDSKHQTALNRLNIECDNLDITKDIDGVVNKIDFFKVWKHHFLVEEFVEGLPLMKWIATNYPFTQNDDINQYFEQVKILILNIIKIVNEMHSVSVAMCDLQPHNIIIADDLKVQFIDFETAKNINDETDPSMVTKGFYNKKVLKAMETDWYSVNRIFQYMLLPIGPVYDFNMSINSHHCHWICKQFGQENYEWFICKQNEILSNITNSSEIFSDTYSQSFSAIDLSLDTIEQKIIKGILMNCDSKRDSLINGDIRQFEQNCGKLNILTGGFGVVSILNKMGVKSEEINNWVASSLERIKFENYNFGFLTGLSGISCALLENGYLDESIEMMRKVITEYDRGQSDLTFRSGLSGIGLAMVLVYNETKLEEFLNESKELAEIIINNINVNEELTTTDWDSTPVGLIDGYSGISLFFSAMYKITNSIKYYDFAELLIDKDLEKTSISDRDGSLQTIANNKVLPYLRNGGIGIGVAIKLLNNTSTRISFESELSAIAKSTDFRCFYEAGLFDGFASMFIGYTLVNSNSSMDSLLEKLSLYMIEEDDAIQFSGKFFYKLSNDLYSGALGVLAGINSAKNKNTFSWLPLLDRLI